MDILLTGGSGLLGQELHKLRKFQAPSHKEFDILNPSPDYKCDLILHGAAWTDVPGAEKNQQACWGVNTFGTRELLRAYPSTPFVYISSEYAGNPPNTYGKSKRGGEVVCLEAPQPTLILRTLFKPRPFPWPKAFVDQYTLGDYVDVIAPLLLKAVETWDFMMEPKKLIYVGTGRKSIYELAKQSISNVGQCSVEDIKDVKIPKEAYAQSWMQSAQS